MKFSEQFPNLKFKERLREFDITSAGYSLWAIERFLEDIQKYCLDKAKVREAIDNAINHGNRREMDILNYLFKELRL